MRISQTFFGQLCMESVCVCDVFAKRMCSSFLRLDILNSTLSSWILAGELFPVLIPKSPRLYSRFPSFLCGGRMKPGIRPQGSFRLNGLEWRRTARCKQYFFTWQQAVLFLIDHVCNFFTYMIHPAFAIQLISSILGIQDSTEGSAKERWLILQSEM